MERADGRLRKPVQLDVLGKAESYTSLIIGSFTSIFFFGEVEGLELQVFHAFVYAPVAVSDVEKYTVFSFGVGWAWG